MMRSRLLFCLLMTSLLVGFAFCQPTGQATLADGSPPLTQEMATDYIHFMQWTLGVPLTLADEDRIRNYLVDTWKANNKGEIERTLNLLALRDYMHTMQMDTEPWAERSLRRTAIIAWKKSPTLDMPSWALAIYAAAHDPVVADSPPLTRQMESAYEELGYFMLNEVDGSKSQPLDAVQRTTLNDALAADYPKLTAEQKANFALLPQAWYQLRNGWAGLDDTKKTAMRTAWKTHFYPKTVTPVKSVKKGAKPPAPTTAPAQTIDQKLVEMTWVLNPDVFNDINSVGPPYGLGWGS